MTRLIFDQSLGYLNTKHSFFIYIFQRKKLVFPFHACVRKVDLLYMHFTCTFLKVGNTLIWIQRECKYPALCRTQRGAVQVKISCHRRSMLLLAGRLRIRRSRGRGSYSLKIEEKG